MELKYTPLLTLFRDGLTPIQDKFNNVVQWNLACPLLKFLIFQVLFLFLV